MAIILRDALKLGLKTRFGINPYGCGELLPKVAKEAAEGTLCIMPNVAYGESVPGMKAILDLWASGDRAAAAGQVSDAMVAELTLTGSIDSIGAGLQRYWDAGLGCPVLAIAGDHEPVLSALAPGR